jgi:hypothetical protein
MKYYTVTITNSISNVSPSDGFIDNETVQQYYAGTPYAFETTPASLTLGLCEAKRRGNVRYHEIIRQIELVSNIWIDPNSIVATGGTALLAPTAISFQVVGLFGDGAFITLDELIPGAYLTSTACITRCIARALINDMFREIDVFDPTSLTPMWAVPVGTTTTVPRFGNRIFVASSFEIGPYATSIAAATATIAVSILF